MSIVVSPSVQLSFADQLEANRGVIGIHNLVTTANISADSEDSVLLASNLANPATYLKWLSATTDEQYITIRLSGQEEVDYVGIADHNFGTGLIPISIEAYTDFDTSGDPEWFEVISDFIPANDSALLLRFVPDYYLGVRIRLQNSFTLPSAAVVYVGKLVVLQRSIYVGHTPIVYGRDTRIVNGTSESGEFLGRVVLSEGLITSFDLKNLTPSWYRAILDPVVEQMKEYTFFWAWRPYSYPAEVGYAWITNNPRPTNDLANGMMTITFELGAVK